MTASPSGPPENAVEFPASDTRPSGFPAALPFVPGVRAAVLFAEDGAGVETCTWRLGEDDDARTAELRQRAGALAAEYQATPGMPEVSRGGSTASAEALHDAAALMPPSLLEHAAALLRSMGDPRGAAEASRVADRVIDASRADGWEVEEDQPQPSPLLVRSARLRRGGVERHLSAGSAPGTLGYVMLMDRAAGEGDGR